MKQLLFIFLFLAFSIGANFAQKNSPDEVHYVNAWAPFAQRTWNMNVVDSGTVKVFYALNAADTGKPETYDDLQCLEIGSHLSKYFSSYVYNSDDTLTVAGYVCQKATCLFRGRDYTAWFSNDIPISNGPWKFGGFPLELE